MILAQEFSIGVTHEKVENESTDRAGRKSRGKHTAVDSRVRDPRWWERIWPAPNVHRARMHDVHFKQIMKAAGKSLITKSTTVNVQKTEKDADTSKYHDMAMKGISSRSLLG